MIELILDGAAGMEEIHDQLANALHFPDFYGRNLDAMYDCMTEVQKDVHIHLINLHALGHRGPALKILLQKSAVLNPHIYFTTE